MAVVFFLSLISLSFLIGTCLVNHLRCYYRKDCGREYMLMKLICSGKPNVQFPVFSKYCQEGGNEASFLVSPLVVAGIVIGLVLFLSCVTIIVGSLRKDTPDGLSYGGSIGELRSTCVEDFPPAFDFDSYVETLSQVNVMYPDSPPQEGTLPLQWIPFHHPFRSL
uniref:Uncharacterized protein n=1 Tax=Sinocyclocheilus rhinocerous TaxID=307959 RepID=A0A673LLB8_9TELE